MWTFTACNGKIIAQVAHAHTLVLPVGGAYWVLQTCNLDWMSMNNHAEENSTYYFWVLSERERTLVHTNFSELFCTNYS